MPAESDATASLYLRDILNTPRSAEVVAFGEGKFAYLQMSRSRRLVCLEVEGGLALPISVTVSATMLSAVIATPRAVHFLGQTISTPMASAAIKTWRDQRLSISSELTRPSNGSAQRDALSLAWWSSLWRTPGLVTRVTQFAEDLSQGTSREIVASTRSLIGLGPGSTPAGDDVVAAAAATLWAYARPKHRSSACAARRLRAVRSAVQSTKESTTPLSAELLGSACDGHAVAPVQRFVSDWRRGVLTNDLSGLANVGHTSGPALALGAAIATDFSHDPRRKEADIA